MDVLITLAGQSKRFYKSGYKKPKFLLPIGGSTVLSEIVKKFDDNDNFHFVLNENQINEDKNLINYIKSLEPQRLMFSINYNKYDKKNKKKD